MRALVLLIVVAALAGCGSDGGGVAVPASSSPAERPTTGTETTSSPPPILLVSAAGTQRAVLGGYCAPAGESGSAALCIDTATVHPDLVSIVRPGEPVSIELAGAQVRKEGSVALRHLGCEGEALKQFSLTPGESATSWQVDLAPGEYELDVFAYFTLDGGGGAGDVSGALGLVVDETGEVAVEPGPPRRSDC